MLLRRFVREYWRYLVGVQTVAGWYGVARSAERSPPTEGPHGVESGECGVDELPIPRHVVGRLAESLVLAEYGRVPTPSVRVYVEFDDRVEERNSVVHAFATPLVYTTRKSLTRAYVHVYVDGVMRVGQNGKTKQVTLTMSASEFAKLVRMWKPLAVDPRGNLACRWCGAETQPLRLAYHAEDCAIPLIDAIYQSVKRTENDAT